MFVLLALLTGFSAVTMVLAGTLSLLRNSGRQEHRWFFLVTLGLAVWVVCNFLGSNIVDLRYTETFVKLDFSLALLSSWLLVQFTASLVSRNPYFSGKKSFIAQRIVFRTVSLGVVLALCIAIAGGFVLHADIKHGSLDVEVLRGFWVYILTVVSLVYYALAILINGYRQTSKKEREGLQVIFVGLLFFVISNIATNLIFPYIFAERSTVQQLNIIGYLGVLALVICIYLAITIKKMFDIRLSVIRGAVYVLTITALGAIYVGPIVYVVGVYGFNLHFTWHQFIFIVLAVTLAAVNFIYVKQWFDGLTRRIFFRDVYNPGLLIGELNKILVSALGLNNMLPEAAGLITGNLKTEFCVFILKNQEASGQWILGTPLTNKKNLPAAFKQFTDSSFELPANIIDADYLAPEHSELRTALAKCDVAVVTRLSSSAHEGAEVMGYMLLGYKKSGNPYNSQDLRTIESISDVLVIAIQNALHYEEIQNFNVTLQRKVDEATRQLRRTNAKLEALDETKDDFISMASHQLRTPLTSVKGYLSMVLEGDAGKLTPMQRKMLDQAYVSSQRMVFLIADLLNISRLKTGKFVIEPIRVNLAQTVADEVKQLRETAKGRSLELTYDKPADFPLLMLDETKLRQVIMNFVDNAIYYTPAGGSIRVELLDKPTSVEFKVTDTGIGVPRAEQPHLFTKFYRAGNARRTRPDGTGLGLFMAKKVVVAQGGAVIFDSREGKGSTFGFIFPKSKLRPPDDNR